MKIKQIHIKHPELGEIIVNSKIETEASELIGDITDDYSNKFKYYHAKITKNDDGTFTIQNLHVIKSESIGVGWMENSKGNKGFITVFTNRNVGEDFTVYPTAIFSVVYDSNNK